MTKASGRKAHSNGAQFEDYLERVIFAEALRSGYFACCHDRDLSATSDAAKILRRFVIICLRCMSGGSRVFFMDAALVPT